LCEQGLKKTAAIRPWEYRQHTLKMLNGSMLSRRDAESNNGLLAKRLGTSTSTKRAPSDRTMIGFSWPLSSMLAAISPTRFLFVSRAPFDRYIDVRDHKDFTLQHT
jgi:hypothetical protein